LALQQSAQRQCPLWGFAWCFIARLSVDKNFVFVVLLFCIVLVYYTILYKDKNNYMPIDGHIEKVQKDAAEKEIFSVTFSNGAWQQLKDLKQVFDAPDELSIVKLGISILEKAREEKEKSKKE
jgi:hypothetical protein